MNVREAHRRFGHHDQRAADGQISAALYRAARGLVRTLPAEFCISAPLPLKCTVVNGNRSFAPGQEALAKSLEWVNPADGSFPTAMAQREYAIARACCCQIRSVLFTD
jgi:hypothetical protein